MSKNISNKGNNPVKFLGLCIGIGFVLFIKIKGGMVEGNVIQNEPQVYAEKRAEDSISKPENKEIQNEKENKELTNQIKTIEVFNKYLKGGLLEDKGEIFYDAAIKQNVNPKVLNFPVLLTSISIHETRTEIEGTWIAGTSDTLKKYNNIAGINWPIEDRTYHEDRYMIFNSINDSIYDLAERLKRYYIDEGKVTIKQIAKKYAPINDKDNGKNGVQNESWEPSVTKIYKNMLKDIS